MVLILAIAVGWIAGLIRSWIRGNPYRVPEFSNVWLVLAAVIPQLLVFQIPFTAGWFSDSWAVVILVCSQLLLLVFIWLNRDKVGIKILGLGLLLNLVVILLNRGLMPIAPETAQSLFPDVPVSAWHIGSRPGRSKNIILPAGDTRLAWLSDSILLPGWFPWTRALSPGDLLIALGVFWLLALEPPEEPVLPEPLPDFEEQLI
jgi:hypothetical protein